MMRRLIETDLFVLTVLLISFIVIRSLNFPYHLNFSTDQAASSSQALEIWQDKKIQLIGPSISFHYIGRDLYYGSATYYMQLMFLLASGFDPVSGSYLFMLFSALMMISLYYGAKMLAGKKGALIISLLYTLFPPYIDFTRFFWNPNFQLALTPILILLIELHAKYKKLILFFALSLFSGFLLLFHYQYTVVILGLLFYYFGVKKMSVRHFFIFASGVLAGFSPILVFEFRNSFYNLQTLILYLSNFSATFSGKSKSLTNIHYFLSILMFVFLTAVFLFRKKIKNKHIVFLFAFLLFWSLFSYVKKPSHAFGMVEDWNYIYEKRANDIIRKQNLKNFNIVNQGYDTVATVQKYLLKKDGVKINYDDYYKNRYLFIITNRKNFMADAAYEMSTFKPAKMLESWKINTSFNMYLMERVEKPEM